MFTDVQVMHKWHITLQKTKVKCKYCGSGKKLSRDFSFFAFLSVFLFSRARQQGRLRQEGVKAAFLFVKTGNLVGKKWKRNEPQRQLWERWTEFQQLNFPLRQSVLRFNDWIKSQIAENFYSAFSCTLTKGCDFFVLNVQEKYRISPSFLVLSCSNACCCTLNRFIKFHASQTDFDVDSGFTRVLFFYHFRQFKWLHSPKTEISVDTSNAGVFFPTCYALYLLKLLAFSWKCFWSWKTHVFLSVSVSCFNFSKKMWHAN